MNELDALHGLGLSLPTPAYLFGLIFFGLAGYALFRFGRRNERPRLKWIGLAMMLYPYLITDTVGLYVVGSLLAAMAWLMRRD
jgi:MFS family permease